MFPQSLTLLLLGVFTLLYSSVAAESSALVEADALSLVEADTSALIEAEKPVPVLSNTCSTIQTQFPKIMISMPNTRIYKALQGEYWNKGCSAMKPTCVIFPHTVQEVSDIVRVLNQNNETFAIKGGGHMPNKYFASVDRGPLISLRGFKQLEFDNSTNTIQVGSGLRWQHVAAECEKHGRMAVTGRMGHVGVPGLLLGGGLSFLSTQYGWASTHVLEYELVLANGTITKASKTQNPDLHRALQSGGNAFGIVTRFTLRTFPIGQVWGGTRFYANKHTPRLLAAVRDFTESYPDPKAGIIVTGESTAYGVANLWVVFFFYDGPNPPVNVFENFTRIAHSTSDTKTQSYTNLVYGNNKYVLNGSYYSIATETMPLPSSANSVEVMNGIHDFWSTTSKPVYKKLLGSIASIAYQPVPKLISQATKKYGGNIMDMGEDGDRIILEYDYSWPNGLSENERIVDRTNRNLYTGTKHLINKYMGEGKVPKISTPLFMNDAYISQDFWGRFTEKAFVKRIKQEVDPNFFFGNRTHSWPM